MDIDHDKAQAALEQLETEKARRLQAKIDSGEVVSQTITVVCTRDEDVEEATARALARHPVPDDGRPVHRELFYIFTGVPRDPDFARWETPQIQTSDERNASRPSDEPARGGEVLSPSPPSEPTYIFVTTRQATNDGDPGAIVEALWSVDDGAVVLTNLEGRHITGRALLKDEDPAAVARSLLREAEEPKDFHRPINYPKLGLA
jgi:hypothetical protein